MPISGVIGRAEIMDAPPPGTLGGTYSGNPVACAAALAVLDLFEKDDYAARSREIGHIITKRFLSLQEQYSIIGDVRGLGGMAAMELVKDRLTKEPDAQSASDVLTAAHLVRNPASGRVMEKCGMHLLGMEKRDHRGVQEEFCVRGITRDDWEHLIAMNAA